MMNYGLISVPESEQRKHYHAEGKVRLGGAALNPGGQWDSYLPKDEVQNLNGIDPQACASFGTLNAVETLMRFIEGDIENLSDRFLAKESGTTHYGNDPHTVAETLRKKGSPVESDWPFSPDIDTWDKFYADIPRNIETVALEFPERYDFGHQWVQGTPWAMKDALAHSPLGVAVYAWAMGDDGLMFRPSGARDNHWVMLYGFEDGVCWHIFDSYTNTHKKLRWDFGFSMVKQYSLFRQVIDETAWGKFKKLMRQILGLVPLGGQSVKPMLWDTPAHIRRNVRVMCDEAGLSLYWKNVLCSCVKQESGFMNYRPDGSPVVGRNRDKNGNILTSDWGVCQYNDGTYRGQPLWIGKGAAFASVDDVLQNPEKAVRIMIAQFKAGRPYLWSSYSTGAYLKWMPTESLPSIPY